MRARDLEARQSQVGSEGALLARKSHLLHFTFHTRREFAQRRRRLDTDPEYARPPRLGEKTESFHLDGERFEPADLPERLHNLFHLRTNLRYGCTILRHYLDIEKGDLTRALGRYNGSLGKREYPTRVKYAWQKHWSLPSKMTAADGGAAG